jgi:hypothetical protein
MREVRTGCQTGGRLCLAAIKDVNGSAALARVQANVVVKTLCRIIEDYHFHYPSSRVPALTAQP